MNSEESIKKYNDLFDKAELNDNMVELQKAILCLPSVIYSVRDYPDETLQQEAYAHILKDIADSLNTVLKYSHRPEKFFLNDAFPKRTQNADAPADIIIETFKNIQQQVNGFTINKHTKIVDFDKFIMQLLTNVNFMLTAYTQINN